MKRHESVRHRERFRRKKGLTAVIRCREQRDKLPLRKELVPVLDDLMRAADEVHVVFLQESRDDVGAEREGHAAVVLGPAGDVLVRVGPEQVTQQAFFEGSDPLAPARGVSGRPTGSLPVSGTSVGRITRRICSILWRSGLRPPCIVKIFSSMIAAIGRQLKQSVKVFHSLMLYRRLPVVVDHSVISIPPEVWPKKLGTHTHRRSRKSG